MRRFLVVLMLFPAVAHAGPSEFESLVSHGWIWAYLGVFAAGVLTSLTPCVYPMIPIVLGIFGARDASVSRRRAFTLASLYVAGMGVMFSGLGVAAALAGRAFGTLLANPWVVLPLDAFYVLLAASMFGAFELNLPSALQTKLNRVGGKGFGGAFAMGLVGGLTAAPCTGPMLLGILAFVATTRNVPLGFSLLLVYAIGMGVLFWVLAMVAMSLPKSGRWMDSVKSMAGIALLCIGLYFLRPVFPVLMRFGSGFLFASIGTVLAGIALGAVHLSFHDALGVKLRKSLGIALCVAGVGAIINHSLTPKHPLSWRHQEDKARAEAKADEKPLLVDFGAEWCLPCKVYENQIFNDPAVHAEIEARFVPLKFDLTSGDDAALDAQERWNAKALPTVILLDREGKELQRFMEPVPTPDEFLAALRKVR